jgi:hypothetical protein
VRILRLRSSTKIFATDSSRRLHSGNPSDAVTKPAR